MMSHTQFLIFIACGAMAAGRFTVPGHGLSYAGTFEAVSHILVGMVIAVIAVNPYRLSIRYFKLTGSSASDFQFCASEYDKTRKFAGVCLTAVSLLELVMAMNVAHAQSFGVPCDETREPIYSYSRGLDVAQSERRPLLVFVTQKVCIPCKAAKRVIESMRQDDELRNCVLVEMDASEPQAKDLMVGRKLTPQLLLLDLRQPRIDKSVNRYAIESEKAVIDKPSINRLLDLVIPITRK